jgi:hypothetical protein
LHFIGGLNIVLDENRNAVQRSPSSFTFALLIERSSNRKRIWIHFDYGSKGRSIPVYRFNAFQVQLNDALSGQRALVYASLKVSDGYLFELEAFGARSGLCGTRSGKRAADGGRSKKCSTIHLT